MSNTKEVSTIQTFLPYPNFTGSAKVLDARRLGKQRVENLQIMQVLLGKRVANTNRGVHTGEFKTVYFDRNHDPIPLSELDPFDVWYEESVPVTVLMPTPRDEWTIEPYEGGWTNHPVIAMWRGYEHALLTYQEAICKEWMDRGHRDSCWSKTKFLYLVVRPLTYGGLPSWFGEEDFHRSHQSNLLRKHPKYYEQFFPDVPHDLPYIWPVPV